ncbi:hypothetical protein MRX96_041863 [Rhipicephalus microplus]
MSGARHTVGAARRRRQQPVRIVEIAEGRAQLTRWTLCEEGGRSRITLLRRAGEIYRAVSLTGAAGLGPSLGSSGTTDVLSR